MVTRSTGGTTSAPTHLALDFVNNRRGVPGGLVDMISSVERFETLAGLTSAAEGQTLPAGLGPPTRRVLAVEARCLRADIALLFQATSEKKAIPEEVLFSVNRIMEFGRRWSGLVVVDGTPRLDTHCDADHPITILSPIAEAAARIVTEAEPTRLRRCSAEACSLWFLDTSKGGQRRWCSMTRCGNRAKSARYRVRHEGEA